ncbi:MAG: glycosyltransferase [Anaerolineae bacterium]
MSTSLAIVIVSYNTRALLAACLDSLAADPSLGLQSGAADAVATRVVVVDNLSADGSAALVRERYPWVDLIESPANLGFAGGNNLALRALGCAPLGDEAPRSAEAWARTTPARAPASPHAAPDFVLLLNPDTTVSPGAIATLLAFLQRTPDAGAAGPRLMYPDGRLQPSAFLFPGAAQTLLDLFPPPGRLSRIMETRLNGRYPSARYLGSAAFSVETLLGACILIRGAAIRRVGLLDEGFFMYAEELDWCRRLTGNGWNLYCVPSAQVVHHEAQSTRQFRQRMFVELWRSRLRLFDKHHSAPYQAALRWLVRVGATVNAWRSSGEQRAAYREVAQLAHPVTPSPRHPVTPSPRHPITSSPRHIVTSSHCHLVTPSSSDSVTAAILTRNEAAHIRDCLASVAWADRCLVVDSGSDDGTARLAREAGAEVVVRPFRDFADQRNAALALVRTVWVLFVDADERVTPALAEEVRQVITRCDAAAPVGYWIPRHNYIFGHLTRGGGWWPDYQLRLLRVGRAHYDPARAVHELVILDGDAGHLREPFIHYNYRDVEQFRHKQASYTAYDAAILYAGGARARPRNFVLQPLREFRRRFVSLGGYRDGLHGLRMAAFMAYYEWVKYAKLSRLAAEDGDRPL